MSAKENSSGIKDRVGTESKGQFTCPMHPEVVSDQPGDCPKCGMHLVPVGSDDAQPHAGHGAAAPAHGSRFDFAGRVFKAVPAPINSFGLGGELRREMGEGRLPVPRAPFVDLASWAKIPFLYAPETRRLAADMARMAVEPERLERFRSVLEHETGHQIAFAVERGKIAANGDGPGGRILLDVVEKGLSAGLTQADLGQALESHRSALGEAAAETLTLAGLTPAQVEDVVLVGGSSLMRFVGDEMRDRFPGAAIRTENAFTAIVDGLAIAAGGAPATAAAR